MYKAVTQNHGLGCGVACVASVLGLNYKQALKLFKKPKNAWTVGFYCKDIVTALKTGNKKYSFKKLTSKNDPILKIKGTIIFSTYSKSYPYGHYLVRTQFGWMNPWINYPEIAPAKSGFVRKLPAKATYAIFEIL